MIDVNYEDAGVYDTFISTKLLGFEKTARNVAAQVGDLVRKY